MDVDSTSLQAHVAPRTVEAEQVSARTRVRPRVIDYGRVVAVAAFTLMATVNALHLARRWDDVSSDALGITSTVLTLAVYVLLIWAYLRRGPATSSDRKPAAWAAALAATVAPFVVPLVATGAVSRPVAAAATVLLAIGLAAMVWGLTALGTNISVIPQARKVATHGPYRLVRHPLYTAEIVAVTGMCLAAGGVWPWLVLAALVTLQVVRARREEALLLRVLPGYADYRSRTPMLVPGLR